MPISSIVQKRWNYCNVLRDDGMSYGDYVEQLTYLLFLKMADERTKPPYNHPSPVPEERWRCSPRPLSSYTRRPQQGTRLKGKGSLTYEDRAISST